ncbi:MAG TPA: type II toxin-antitoxin system VapC family toxin [Thermoanaerobaculia bacterium]|nr:type II toxin-antitoxin system VapC family toxin [Thermoanaerobaculia bacterium]
MTEIVIDTSAIVAVITDAPEKAALIRITEDAALVAPSSVHWEVGNAFSAMIRRGRLTSELAGRAIEIYESIPIRFVDVSLTASLAIASEHRLYAYDAYLIECSRARRGPLLTLDRALARVAAKMMIDVVEVS